MEEKYYNLTVKEVFKKLKTTSNGLTKPEVLERFKKYGENKLLENKKFSGISLFLRQFKNPLIYILIFAGTVSFIANHQTDALIILAVIAISTMVGFFQEYKANSALAQLKSLIKYKARVIRNGKETVIGQENLVPGDVVVLNPGDKVPADARLIEVKNLEIIEASLTGESMPIEKKTEVLEGEITMAERINMIYLGTVVARGNGKAVVTATGSETEIGQIANLVTETEEGKTPLQEQMYKFGKTIGFILILINFFIFGLGIFRGQSFLEMFLTSVAMVVAGVPEGLLPAMTVILAVGMQKLAKRKGLVRKMLATETLGAVSVICSDKTGTLTQGEMRVAEIITEKKKISKKGNAFSEVIELDGDASHITALKIGLLCNNAIIENPEDEINNWNILGNPTEKALLLAGRAAGLHKEKLEKDYPRVAEIPFESEYKYMVTGHKVNTSEMICYLKGAPERVLALVSFVDVEGEAKIMSQEKKQQIQEQCDKLTSSGLRVIAVGYRLKKIKNGLFELNKKNLKDFVFVGFIALKDPLRAEAREAIEICQKAGIRPVIITGDHKLTAIAIVKDLGLKITKENVLEGVELDNLSDKELNGIIKKIKIFARVEPRHKIRIVNALQAHGKIVAMTGDGINDAPALKKADISIVVGSGTDVAKETADLVLLDDNFKTITEAIRIGRGTYDNIKKVVLYLLSSSLTEIVLIGLSLAFGLPLALLPVQILWMKMIEEPFPAMALALDSVKKSVMDRKPRKPKDSILSKNLIKMVLFFALIADGLLFLIFFIAWEVSQDVAYAQTIAFVGLGLTSRLYIFSARGLTRPILSYNIFENKLVNLTTIFGILMIVVAVYVPFLNNILKTVPLGIKEWGVLIIYALVSLVFYEIGKKLFISKD